MTDPGVAFIVGATAGVGRRVASTLADQRWRVAVCFRDQHFEAALVVRDLSVRTRREAQPLDCAFEDPVAVARVVRYLEARWRAIDALIWAATPGDLPPPGSGDPLVALAEAILPGMKARGRGRVITLAPGPALAATARLDREHGGGGVTFNAVTPEGYAPSEPHGLRPIPVGYLPGIVDVFDAVRFFLSDTAGRLSGADLRVADDWRDDDTPFPEPTW